MLEPSPLVTFLLILLVVMVFNLIIFIHELGHFWAAKWRGLKIDRFQIWFGKPIWKKTINGVQYGLGWIPAGGFVALPQMAPMEAIEGDNRSEDGEPLPPISPLDKIIVAFAGPLFSFLLAFVSAVILWVIAKPIEYIPTTAVGWIEAGSPGDKAGFKRGDKILAVNGQEVDSWNKQLDSVVMNVVVSKGDKIIFTIDRPGEGVMELTSGFEIEGSRWWERRKPRQVGIYPMAPEGDVVITYLSDDENAPARIAGIQVGDIVTKVDGVPVVQNDQLYEKVFNSEGEPIVFTVKRDGEEQDITVTPRRMIDPNAKEDDQPEGYKIGVVFGGPQIGVREWVNPGPFQQVAETLRTMWITITTVASPKSSIGIQHLSGPVGIGKIQYYSLLMDFPLHRILGVMVLININLALLNMLPFPVLDGGHITIATMEAIARRPVNVRFLEVLQMAFVFLLFGIMIYVTSKDIPDDFGMGSGEKADVHFPPPDQ